MNLETESNTLKWTAIAFCIIILCIGFFTGLVFRTKDKQQNHEQLADTDRTEIIMHSIRMENDIIDLERRIERLEQEEKDD